jgi:DNA-binding SARP family transcriptional activator
MARVTVTPEARRIIRGKLRIPALPDAYVPRPRLEHAVAALVAHKRVVVVSASAGSGKTTAVTAVAREVDRPVAWLTVDRPDQAPGRLLTYLEAAIADTVPEMAGMATEALAAGVSHVEAAGLLADALVGERDDLLLVLDELERLGDERHAWQVVEAFLRYLPDRACVVLISRRDIPTSLCALSPDRAAVLADTELAFTSEEAGRALAGTGRGEIRVEAAMASTAGWVTGVLFHGWRAGEHLVGQGGETDPLYDYLSSQMLGELGEAEREFLIRTSLLDEVTAGRAEALGILDADQRLTALRRARLPVAWEAGGRLLRCHTYFREYLVAQLERGDADQLRSLHLAHGRLLCQEGHYEEATEELLLAGAADHAIEPAEKAIVAVVERLDLALAERWLAELAPSPPGPASALSEAELMLAIARDDVFRGVQTADRLSAEGERQALASASQRAALLMAWCYLHTGRLKDVDAVLAAAGDGPGRATMRYARDALFGLGEHGRPFPPDPPPPGPIGAIVVTVGYALGRLSEITEAEASRWAQLIQRPWRVAALRARGRTEEALDLFAEAREAQTATPAMVIYAGPELMADAGRWDEARRLLDEGHRVALAGGSLAYQGTCWLVEAKLALRERRDATAALAALAEPVCRAGCAAFHWLAEVSDTWAGCAALLTGDDERARELLERACAGMVAGDRMLELPTAAVYLAEARWRGGEDKEASAAAGLALEAAKRQGSNHILLQALADFPTVAAREVESSPADSEWHGLSQALMAQGQRLGIGVGHDVQLVEFGRRAILVAGSEVKPRITKSYELLAYLAAAPDRGGNREELLQALFGDRRDDATRSYLRQTVHRLREVLPEGALTVKEGHVSLTADVGFSSESVTFERRLSEAPRLQGDDRLQATLAALAIFDRGEYLPGSRGEWADIRQQRLADLATGGSYQAAVLALGNGDYALARKLATDVLRVDRFRETAWRVLMRVAAAVGDEDGVLRVYRTCEAALAEINAQPSASTRRLVEHDRDAGDAS